MNILKYAVVFMLIACNRLAPQEACSFRQDSELQRLSIHDDITLHLSSSVPPEYNAAIKNAANVWNNAIGRTVIRLGTGVVSANYQHDMRSTIYYVKDWKHKASIEAVTQSYSMGASIYEADILVNGQYKFSVEDRPVTGHVDMESLMIHEFGHVLGLGHIEGQSVMNKGLATGVLRRKLYKVDIDSIKCEY